MLLDGVEGFPWWGLLGPLVGRNSLACEDKSAPWHLLCCDPFPTSSPSPQSAENSPQVRPSYLWPPAACSLSLREGHLRPMREVSAFPGHWLSGFRWPSRDWQDQSILASRTVHLSRSALQSSLWLLLVFFLPGFVLVGRSREKIIYIILSGPEILLRNF